MTLQEALADPRAELTAPPHLAGTRTACATAAGWTYSAIQPAGSAEIHISGHSLNVKGEAFNTPIEDEDLPAELDWRPGLSLLRNIEENAIDWDAAHPKELAELTPIARERLVRMIFGPEGNSDLDWDKPIFERRIGFARESEIN